MVYQKIDLGFLEPEGQDGSGSPRVDLDQEDPVDPAFVDPTGQLTQDPKAGKIEGFRGTAKWVFGKLRGLFRRGKNRGQGANFEDSDSQTGNESPRAQSPQEVTQLVQQKVVSLGDFRALKAENDERGIRQKVLLGEHEIDPEVAIKYFEYSVAALRERLGETGLADQFNIPWDRVMEILKFGVLPGYAVGQATEDAILHDPYLLFHPKVMGAYVLASELFHNNAIVDGKRILGLKDNLPFEGLLEYFVSILYPECSDKSLYLAQRERVGEFVKLFDPRQNSEENVVQIMGLFMNAQYSEVVDRAQANNPGNEEYVFNLFQNLWGKFFEFTRLEPGVFHQDHSWFHGVDKGNGTGIAANDDREIVRGSGGVESVESGESGGQNVEDLRGGISGQVDKTFRDAS